MNFTNSTYMWEKMLLIMITNNLFELKYDIIYLISLPSWALSDKSSNNIIINQNFNAYTRLVKQQSLGIEKPLLLKIKKIKKIKRRRNFSHSLLRNTWMEVISFLRFLPFTALPIHKSESLPALRINGWDHIRN